MSKNFWTAVNKIIEKSDVLIEVLDSRMPDLTRNIEIEKKIESVGKPIIYVLNKCDLADTKILEKKKKQLEHAIFVSSVKMFGTTMLKEKIHATAKKDKVIVGVLGYPNTGKSSLINALAGKAKAKASNVSGYTKGYQYVSAGRRILLIDTPGVIPFKEDDEIKHALIGTKSFHQIKDPDLCAMAIIKELEGAVEEFYGVGIEKDEYDSIESIAIKKGKLLKGGEPDIDNASRMIIRDWQNGKIRMGM